MDGTPRPATVSQIQARIAHLAKQMPGVALTSLSQHADLTWMREAYERTRKDGASGVDGVTAKEFETQLEDNLQTLLNLAKSGNYRAPPVRRVHIPKGDGSKTRPIGIPTLSDKVLQRATEMLLTPLYEQDFCNFSYGFRPGRSAHDAVEALREGLHAMGGGWVLDVDIKSFFDTIDHQKLRDLLRQRVADGVMVRLVGKWLRAGVLEGGVVTRSEEGTPQGGVISPLLANIYLHEVLDKWWVEQVRPRMRGSTLLVRYADDFVMAFSRREDALRVHAVLAKRFERFGLTLHPEKTRMVRFVRPRTNDKDPPGSFDFLGFTHHWAKSRKGYPVLKRKTAKGRFTRALKAVGKWLSDERHRPVREQAQVLRAKLKGHFQYYGITGNSEALQRFRYEVERLWRKWLGRRSQRAVLTWEEFNAILSRHPLPPARLPRRQLRLANL